MEKFNIKLFIVLAVLASIASFLVFFKVEQAYKTEIDILILPRNEKTAQSLDQTVESIKQIPLSLSFYNKMLEINKDIEDGAAGEMDYKRKEFWNKKINAQRIDGSGVIRFEVFDKKQEQSEIIASQLKNDIFFLISKYYNIKTDLEPRLIDGPITGNTVSDDIWKNIAKSVGLGMVAAFFLTLIISGLNVIISGRKQDLFSSQYSFRKDILPEKELNEDEDRNSEYKFSEHKSAAEKALVDLEARETSYHQEMLKRKKEIYPEDYSASEEIKDSVISTDRKVSAPINLPFTEEELPEIFNGNNKNEEISKETAIEEATETSYKEATPEEVQARIAKLLNGRI